MWDVAGGIFLFFALLIGGCIAITIPVWIIYGIKCIIDDWKAMGVVAKRSREAVHVHPPPWTPDQLAYRRSVATPPLRHKRYWWWKSKARVHSPSL